MELVRKFDTLVDIYTKSTEAYGKRPFLGEKKAGSYRWMTYAEFGEAVEAARGGLAALGVQRGDRVAIVSENLPEWAVLAFATYTLGAVWVSMYEAQKPEERTFICNDCQPTVLITRTTELAKRHHDLLQTVDALEKIVVLRPGAVELPPKTLAYEDLLQQGRTQSVPIAKVDRDDLANLIYTSGTTGAPKGVMLSHGNIADNVNALNQVFPSDPGGETSVAFLPWAHSFGQVCELYGGLSLGGKAGLAESPQTLLTNIGEIRPTVLFSVPLIWNRVYTSIHKRMADQGGLAKRLFDRALEVAARRQALAEQGKRSAWIELQHSVLDKLVFAKVREALGGRLKYAVSGAAALSPEVARFLSYLGITVSEGYGLTESSPIATYNPLEAPRIGTVGKPIPGVEIRVAPAETAPEGQGEIVIYGHNVMMGYYNRDEENRDALDADGGLHTGDMGYIDEDGYVHITGRVKEQYKLENGKYVVPAPLEEQLKLSPLIEQVYIHGANKPYNVALIVPEAEAAEAWAAEKGLGDLSLSRLCENSRFRKAIQQQIDSYGAKFKGFESIKKFTLIPEPFTPEDGTLTPTLKLKRPKVEERYAETIAALYG